MMIVNHALEWNTKSSHIERNLSAVNEIIVHHSATSEGTVESFHRFHVYNNGWYGIGYHYVIYKDGSVHAGRPLTVVGAHTSGHNQNSIGVCLVGNFESEQPTAAQYKALAELISYLEAQLGRSLNVTRHSDYNQTACPGKNYDFTEVEKVWMSSPADDAFTYYCPCCGVCLKVVIS